MRVNVDKVLERDQKLSELDDRADALQAGASQFETSAAKLKRKYWWKNCKVPKTHFVILYTNLNLLISYDIIGNISNFISTSINCFTTVGTFSLLMLIV